MTTDDQLQKPDLKILMNDLQASRETSSSSIENSMKSSEEKSPESDYWAPVMERLSQQNPYLPKNWESKWFDNFNFDNLILTSNAKVRGFWKWISETKLDSPMGFVLSGKTGAGKSHLLMSALKVIGWRFFYENNRQFNHQVQYWPYYDLCSYFRQEPNDFDRLKKVREAKFLFIDDVGTSKVSDFIQERIFSIYDFRCQNELPTFITTNLSGEQISKEFSERMTSRMKECAMFIPVEGTKDFRNNIYRKNQEDFNTMVAQ